MAGKTIAVHTTAGIAVLLLVIALVIVMTYPIRRISYCPSPWVARIVYVIIAVAVVLLLLSAIFSFTLN